MTTLYLNPWNKNMQRVKPTLDDIVADVARLFTENPQANRVVITAGGMTQGTAIRTKTGNGKLWGRRSRFNSHTNQTKTRNGKRTKRNDDDSDEGDGEG